MFNVEKMRLSEEGRLIWKVNQMEIDDLKAKAEGTGYEVNQTPGGNVNVWALQKGDQRWGRTHRIAKCHNVRIANILLTGLIAEEKPPNPNPPSEEP